MSAVRRRSHSHEHDSSLHHVEHAVWNIRGCPHHSAGADFAGVAPHDYPRLSGHDQIKFVRSGMHMSLLRLSRLEAVQAHKHLPARKQVRLGARVTAERGESLYRLEVVGHTPPQTRRIP